MAVGEKADRIAFSEEMGKFYEGGDYFGLAKDTSGALEDTLHNEMYFDQFLAWFGTSLMSGVFVNVVDAIDNPKQPTAGDSSSLTKIELPDTSVVVPPDSGDIGIEKVLEGIPEGIRLVDMKSSMRFSVNSNAAWSVYDMNGHKVGEGVGREFVWNTFHRKGVYLVKASTRTGNYLRKVLVK